jgi:hypothetical protein
MRANTTILKIFNAIEKAHAPPAEAGTPNLRATNPIKSFKREQGKHPGWKWPEHA